MYVSSEELLARAGLALNEHADGALSDPLRERVELDHHGIADDDARRFDPPAHDDHDGADVEAFPGLDGGRLLIIAIEGVRRRPVSPRLVTSLTLAGMALLVLLMLVVSYHDIAKLVG